jgi:2-isopropylmalate synthase
VLFNFISQNQNLNIYLNKGNSIMKNINKYTRQYYPVANAPARWVNKETIQRAPVWCSVDLRDGNQALIVPMRLMEKLEFFKTLVHVGFKEIEVGFPAASETEFQFVRTLIEQNLIPNDVTIQVLTQARDHIIQKTFEALRGARSAIVHVYNSTSFAQREQVFKKSRNEIIKIAVEGAKLVKHYAAQEKGNFRFQYSPESFTGTEPDFAVEICNAVLDVWQPTADKKAIINLPATVQHSLPHIYANQIEYVCDNLKYRENVVVSLHPHNDRGTAIADCELGLLAGADRIEGTLFGNGERTGNADIVTVALNMYSQGIDPKLNLTNIPELVSIYEHVTHMRVYERSPYAGALVFCAFSGSHQDAIAKGMKFRETNNPTHWTVPYLPIDPTDLGRSYDADVIRINSQSGKGGVGYILEQFGYNLPPKMREAVGYAVKDVSDKHNKELTPSEVELTFIKNFVDVTEPIRYITCEFFREEKYIAILNLERKGKLIQQDGTGNGNLEAAINAIEKALDIKISDVDYTQHTLGAGADSNAISYIGVRINDKKFFGAGIDNDIMTSSIKALISAINNHQKQGSKR